MKTYEKINLLMNITETTNAKLSKVLAYDPSHISRLRNGTRAVPNKRAFIETFAAYITDKIVEPYQKASLNQLICPNMPWPDTSYGVEALLIRWLYQKDSPDQDFTGDISLVQGATNTSQDASGSHQAYYLYYGDKGKRAAILKGLEYATTKGRPSTLYIYSNENFNWISTQDDFNDRWQAMICDYVEKGGKIEIIHELNRDLGNMILGLQKWIPIYLAGGIKSYYYPMIRDGVSKRTLFVSEGQIGLTANSVGNSTDGMLNALIFNKQAIEALKNEFIAIRSMCLPLVKPYTLLNTNSLRDALNNLVSIKEDSYIASSTPIFAMLPPDLAEKIGRRFDSRLFMHYYESLDCGFKNLLEQGYKTTLILNLPEPEVVKNGQASINLSDIFHKPNACFTQKEFILCIESLIDQLKAYDNLQVLLSDVIPKDQVLATKKHNTSFILRAKSPTIAYTIEEQRLNTAIWQYLDMMLCSALNKEKTLHDLEDYLKQIQG